MEEYLVYCVHIILEIDVELYSLLFCYCKKKSFDLFL